MSKKQIIDGVDVSECPHYIDKDGSCSSHDCECVKCVHNVCFYKDYKAKEQECEELKAKFQDMKKSRDVALKEYNEEFEYKRQITVEHLEQKKELLKQLDQLKAENEELKKWQENVVNMFDKTCRCKYLNEENAHCSFYNKECIAINQCLYRNQQTLTEIKEIIHFNKTNRLSGGAYISIEQILQKISECEGNNELTK